MNTILTPRIYVVCLATYNAGGLHGEWIDADQDIDQLWSKINGMLAASPEENAEEWAIHDFEGFGSFSLNEYEGIESVQEMAVFIGEHGELGAEVIVSFLRGSVCSTNSTAGSLFWVLFKHVCLCSRID